MRPVFVPQVAVLRTGDVVPRVLLASRLLRAYRRQRLVEWSSVLLSRSVLISAEKVEAMLIRKLL